jgi:hypothetical protein
MKQIKLLQRFQKTLENSEVIGVDIFDDMSIQFYHEKNPKESFSEECRIEEFLQGKFQDEIRSKLGKENLELIRYYLLGVLDGVKIEKS